MSRSRLRQLAGTQNVDHNARLWNLEGCATAIICALSALSAE
jgi:hypothetical protein